MACESLLNFTDFVTCHHFRGNFFHDILVEKYIFIKRDFYKNLSEKGDCYYRKQELCLQEMREIILHIHFQGTG